MRGVLALWSVFLAVVPFGAIVLLLRAKVTWLQTIDQGTATGLHGFDEAHPWFVTIMRVVTWSGSSPFWAVTLTPTAFWLLYRRRYRLAAYVPVTAFGSSVINNAIKNAVGRTRPVLDDPIATVGGKSFPSGHTQAALVGYGILVLVFLPTLPRRWRPAFVAVAGVMVALVGFSRVALGVHYLSDVVGGLLIGSAWLLAMTAVFFTGARPRP